jgi:hypothetical protein
MAELQPCVAHGATVSNGLSSAGCYRLLSGNSISNFIEGEAAETIVAI